MFTSLVALSITFILFQNTWLTWIGKFLVIQDTLEPGDVIHVIAGDDYRTDYAFQLYREGYAKKIFFYRGMVRDASIRTWSACPRKGACSGGVVGCDCF